MAVGICLPKDSLDSFKKALVSGKLTPEKLALMTSEERHVLFSEVVGKGEARWVNSQFEGKLLLKNQQRGYLTWAKKISGVSPSVKRDLISRIQRMDKVLSPEEEKMFLKDLAETRLGFGVTVKEAKYLTETSKRIEELETKAKPDGSFADEATRLDYGLNKVHLENFINDAKLNAKKISFKEQPITKIKNTIGATPGVAKSLLSSLDDSLYGRQGIKTLLNLRTSDIWVKNFLKSFRDIGRQLKAGGDAKTILTSGDDRAMNLIKADIYSRPNAVNGKYEAGGYGLNVMSEEAYPSAIAEKIPALGRLFKASEVAYNGGALRLRADAADRFIKIAEKQGIDTLNKEQAQGIGTLIGGMTGRGHLGKAESLGKELNVLLFSVKFLKSNFDTLTLHLLDSKATAFTRKQAAINMAGMVSSIGAIMALAHSLDPKSVETDPRSTHFGKIKVHGTWVDITGGMGAMATLAARTFVPTKHDGQWGLYSKSNSGTISKLNDSTFGNKNAADTFDSFLQGKAAPATKVLLDIWKGQNYHGDKPTVKNELAGNTTPLPIQNYNQLKDAKNASVLIGMIADGFGLSVSVQSKKNLAANPTGADKQLLDKIGKDKFQDYNNKYNQKLDTFLSSDLYTKMSDEEKQRALPQATRDIKANLYKQYNFKATRAKTDKQFNKSILSAVK